jgi:hypothetical protein
MYSFAPQRMQVWVLSGAGRQRMIAGNRISLVAVVGDIVRAAALLYSRAVKLLLIAEVGDICRV